jgi:Calx-beta domain
MNSFDSHSGSSRVILKFANCFLAGIICVIFSFSVSAQFFTLPGAHLYALNSNQQVFDISPDGKIGISVRNDPVGTHPAILTTFDPIFGTQMDSKTFGFGPLQVSMAQVGNSLRAVVLTSEGGPRRIYLFDVSSNGQLTQLASTQLTTSNSDDKSNFVLSGPGQAGFVTGSTNNGSDIVSFSLIDGAILNRLQGFGATTLSIKELPSSRLLIFRMGAALHVVNAQNPSQLVAVGSVPLVSNGESSGVIDDGVAISADGRYVFLGNQFFNFAAIDLSVMQVVGTIPGNYRFGRVRISENNNQRLLAVLSSSAGTGGVSAILLVNATDPSNLTILNQYIPPSSESFFYKSDFGFSQDGARLYAAPKEKLIAFDLPTFNKAWEQPVPQPLQVHQLKVYGPSDEILGAWDATGGLGFTGIFGAFPAFPPNVSVSDSLALDETAGTANFTISLSAPSSHRVTVNYSTADGTAQKGADYTETTGSVIFEPGVTMRTAQVPILDDNIDEIEEIFTFTISPNLGILTRSQSTVTILDDDPPPSASIGDVSVSEGNTGTRNANFQVILSVASGKTITLNYATAAGTATADTDYNSANGTVTFSPGQTVSGIAIQLRGDALNEGDEAFVVNLSNPVNVTVADGQGGGTIVDDDAPRLATEPSSQRAIALNSLLFVRDPFAITNPNYFGTDQRTRIMIFSTNLMLTPDLMVTAQAEDAQQVVYPLTIEFVGSLPTFIGFAQIVVKLPDGIVSAGDLQVSISARGRTSNKVLVGVTP